MAKTKPYIVQYRMPLGLENPKINIPVPNTPVEFDLTEGDVAMLRRLIPDIKCVPANKAKKEAPKKKEVKEPETSEEEKDSENPEETSEPETTSEGVDAETEDDSEEAEDSEKEPQGDAEETPLPDDFPGHDHLVKAGLDTIEKVTEFKLENDLTELDGIGSATADKITDQLMK